MQDKYADKTTNALALLLERKLRRLGDGSLESLFSGDEFDQLGDAYVGLAEASTEPQRRDFMLQVLPLIDRYQTDLAALNAKHRPGWLRVLHRALAGFREAAPTDDGPHAA